MATAGRGRGWGKNLPENTDGLRKPGKQSPPVVIENYEWFELINNIDINDVESIKSSTSPIARLIPSHGPEENKRHLTKFCELALDDRTFAIKLTLTFSNPSNSLSLFMESLQSLYKEREELKKKNPARFLNMVFFLGEVYYRTRPFAKLPFLGPPLVICWQMLLESAEEDEIELLATQIVMNGRPLFDNPTVGLTELFIHARQVLATRNLSTRSRSMLLLMIDLYNHEFMPLSNDLQIFYANQLGQSTLLEMQRNNDNLLVINNPELQETRNVKSKKNNSKNIMPRGEPGRPMNSVPRAIRGSGAIENHEHKNRTFDSQSHRNNINKGYGHDDRFSKDY